MLRQGASGAFGYLHALLDHNADQQTIEHVISNNAGGYLQPNGRYLYGMGYLSEDGIEILVEVIQERDSSANRRIPTNSGLSRRTAKTAWRTDTNLPSVGQRSAVIPNEHASQARPSSGTR